jgi:hypothetical protein
MAHHVAQKGEKEGCQNGDHGDRPFLPRLSEENIISGNTEKSIDHGKENVICHRFGEHNHPLRQPIPFKIFEICHTVKRCEQKNRKIRNQIKEKKCLWKYFFRLHDTRNIPFAIISDGLYIVSSFREKEKSIFVNFNFFLFFLDLFTQKRYTFLKKLYQERIINYGFASHYSKLGELPLWQTPFL